MFAGHIYMLNETLKECRSQTLYRTESLLLRTSFILAYRQSAILAPHSTIQARHLRTFHTLLHTPYGINIDIGSISGQTFTKFAMHVGLHYPS